MQEEKTTTIATAFQQSLEKFFDACLSLNNPVAIWRLPNDHTIQGICQLEESTYPDNLKSDLEGFVFNPFQINGDHPKNFISADLLISNEEPTVQSNPKRQVSESKIDEFMQALETASGEFDPQKLSNSPNTNEHKEDFIQLVDQCKNLIKSGQYQKIVPARQHKFELKPDFNPIHEFMALTQTYSHAFISLVYIPEHGLWLGATPETLISVRDGNQFETVSLAGTQAIPEDFNLKHAAWTHKEIEEQALVSRYIINCFKKIRLREFDEYGPKTVKAANLIHLKTIFKVDMDAVNFPELGSVMLELLHPTSAVCGMPMKEAAAFIKENEPFDRAYFSGYLGPVNLQDEIRLFVNLRCAQIFQDAGIVFAGAGVTEDSDPASEWLETQMKFQTLLNVIGN